MKTRLEHDSLGEIQVPADAYYGAQTLRAMVNFKDISGITISDHPYYVKALAMVKWAAAHANVSLGTLEEEIGKAIKKACEEIMEGALVDQFPVDLMQGGAGTSTNMNINEVVANRALEILGHKKGEYQYCHPNDHVNLSQSTNDAYPTSFKLCFILHNEDLVRELKRLIDSFRAKGKEFNQVIKMGRTQLQDAVPMTLGQEFEAFAATLDEEVSRLNEMARLCLEVNMGATAIGTGIANSISRLKDSKAVSKVIILLTDGSNNRGEITPLRAAEMAKLYNIKIYTIAVGTNKQSAPYPYGGQIINVPVEIDEGTLRSIASTTGGKFYRATSKDELSRIYEEIDQLERTKLHTKEYTSYEEEFMIFALIALAALLAEIALRNILLRKIP